MKLLVLLLANFLLVPAAIQAPASATSASADRAQAVQGNNAYAVDLYCKLRRQPDKPYFSYRRIENALNPSNFTAIRAGASWRNHRKAACR